MLMPEIIIFKIKHTLTCESYNRNAIYLIMKLRSSAPPTAKEIKKTTHWYYTLRGRLDSAFSAESKLRFLKIFFFFFFFYFSRTF